METFYPAQDDDEAGTPAYVPLTIAPLALPSGGTVQFRDPEELTGKDMKALRKALDVVGVGSATTEMFETAYKLLVDAWDIPGRPNLRTPRYDGKQGATGHATDYLTARDLRALENHVKPVIKEITKGSDEEDDGEVGGPHRPASV